MAVAGVDACRAGWVGIVIDGRSLTAVFGATLEELVERAQAGAALTHIGLDMPIGLPERDPRPADLAARAMLGPRRSSVFLAPPRTVIEADTYVEANRRSRQRTGAGLSRQAYGLRPKILEVNDWVDCSPVPVFEVHPEVSFATMAGAPLPHSKRSWAGMRARMQLLADAGLDLPADLGRPGEVSGVDDVLDAAVVAWSAQRIHDGVAVTLPDGAAPSLICA